jgi:hypothetical protein
VGSIICAGLRFDYNHEMGEIVWNLAQQLKLFATVEEFRRLTRTVDFSAGECFYIRFDLCSVVYNWNLDEERKLYGEGRFYQEGGRYRNCQLHGWERIWAFICARQGKKTIALNQFDMRGIAD